MEVETLRVRQYSFNFPIDAIRNFASSRKHKTNPVIKLREAAADSRSINNDAMNQFPLPYVFSKRVFARELQIVWTAGKGRAKSLKALTFLLDL